MSFLKLITLSLLLGGCIGPLTSTPSGDEKKREVKKEKIKSGAATTLEIDAGGAAGTSVDFPDGALPDGSEVALKEVSQPTDFSIDGVSKASSSIEVLAKGPDGSEVSELSQPMTIAIPYSGAALALADVKVDNLCALLKSKSGLFVFRRDALTIDSTASVTRLATKFLGVFQLVYCGQDEVKGFKDANDEGIAEKPAGKEVSMSLKIDGKRYGYGQDKLCVVVATGNDDDKGNDDEGGDAIIIGFADADIEDGTNEITVKYNSGDFETGQDSWGAVAVFYQRKEASSCKFEIGKPDDVRFEQEHSVVFYGDGSEFSSANLSGEFGKGRYAMSTVTLKVGVPESGYSPLTPIEIKGCIQIENEGDSQGGDIESSIHIQSDGQINETSTLSFDVPSVGGSDYTAEVEFGKYCDEEEDHDFTIQFPNVKAEDELHLASTSISIAGASGSNSCVRLYEPSWISSAVNSDLPSGDEKFFASYSVSNNETFFAYVPWDPNQSGTPKYDMNITSEGCQGYKDSSASGIINLNDRVLTPEITQ